MVLKTGQIKAKDKEKMTESYRGPGRYSIKPLTGVVKERKGGC